MRDWRSGTPSSPRRALRPARSSPIRVSLRSAGAGAVSMVVDGIDMTFRFRRVSRPNRHIMPCRRKAKGESGKMPENQALVVVIVDDLVGRGEEPDRGVVPAIDQKLLEGRLELGEIDGRRL